MNRERWRQVDDIFKSALERPPGERRAFLAAACAGDEGLLREVESLLAHDEAGSFLETPALEEATRLLASADDEGEPAPGQLFGPYEVLEKIGVGGMGVVFRALDTKLGRNVALKLLPAEYTRDASRLRRFEREARAASSLNHPNILTVHEVGESGGTHFIATEFVEGETLRALISRGALAPERALDIAAQVADALDVAHEAGIVHRDIKPENVMVRRRDGYVKVLDFGLAKLAEPEGAAVGSGAVGAGPTETGIAMGTPRYMSPEQARGRGVDARTDLWSLGVLLYEMLSGEAPFTGETTQDVMASILKDEPPPLPPRVPDGLREVVARTLRKDKEGRYGSAAELLADLRSLKQSSGATPLSDVAAQQVSGGVS